MSYKLNIGSVGQVGVLPRRNQMVSTDSLADIMSSGYINPQAIKPLSINPTDIFDVIYDYDEASKTGTYAQFQVSISSIGVITLSPTSSLPVRLLSASNISGTYDNGTSGIGATLTVAASSLTIDSTACVNGDRVLLQTQSTGAECGIYVVSGVGSSAVVLTRSSDFNTVAQMVPGFTVTVQAGTIYAGATFALIEPQPTVIGTSDIVFVDASSMPSTVTLQNDGLKVYDPTDSFTLQITPGSNLTANRIFTLATGDAARTLNISAANVTISSFGATLVDDSDAASPRATLGIIAATTASYAGGGTSNAFTATGLTASSKVSAVIRASTNAVAIAKALPGTNLLTVTFTADPGANTTVDYIAIG
jgi:hypothetical protein